MSLGRAQEQRTGDAQEILAPDRSGARAPRGTVGVDPSAKKKAELAAIADSFEAVAREWLEMQAKPDEKSGRAALAGVTLEKAKWIFETLLFPYLGQRPISKITPLEVLQVLKRIEARGKRETCHRAKQRCGQIFRYAIATGRAERDVTSDLRGALAPVVTKHHASITEPNAIGELLRAIDYTVDGNPQWSVLPEPPAHPLIEQLAAAHERLPLPRSIAQQPIEPHVDAAFRDEIWSIVPVSSRCSVFRGDPPEQSNEAFVRGYLKRRHKVLASGPIISLSAGR